MKRALLANTVLVGLFWLMVELTSGSFSLGTYIAGVMMSFLPCLILTTVLLGLYKLISLIWE